uniref:Uncharacterized protein n=1 Tax=Glossina pallidipes TaxID=7398 RepID=A0A1A9ZIY9_GLOPL
MALQACINNFTSRLSLALNEAEDNYNNSWHYDVLVTPLKNCKRFYSVCSHYYRKPTAISKIQFKSLIITSSHAQPGADISI